MEIGKVTINFNNFQNSDIGRGIREALADPGLGGQYLRDFVNQLPRSVRGIELIEDTSITSWQTHIANGTVYMKINPNSSINKYSPGSIFHHEISHKVGHIDDTAKIRADEYVSNNPAAFAQLVVAAGSEEIARRAVQYGFEENMVQIWANGYRDATGEDLRKVTSPTKAMKAYLEYLGYAPTALLDSIDLPESIYDGTAFDPANTHCFLADTPIQMWPLDPSIKPGAGGCYDEQYVLSKVWEKQISDICVGDLVVSYDDNGRIKPGAVTRTMTNTATHLLDFWNTGATPGHAYYCADGKFKDQHVPLMDILRTDGAIMRADGTLIRAATNCEVGSMGDLMIHASASLQNADGTWTQPKPGKVRFGTRIILPDGTHMSFMEMAADEGWKVSDDGYMVGSIQGEDGTLREQKFHFPYAYGKNLPKPEDYILARSDVTLEAIYAAGEWEQIGTQMPAPANMVGLNTNHTSTLLRPSKLKPNIPPAFENHPDAPTSDGLSVSTDHD